MSFFIFLPYFNFWGLYRVKGQKTGQNNKKLSVTLHVSGTRCHMMSIVVHNYGCSNVAKLFKK